MSNAAGRVRHKDSSARGLRTDGYAITRGRVKPERTLHGCDRSADLLNSFVGSCVQELLTEQTRHTGFKREGGEAKRKAEDIPVGVHISYSLLVIHLLPNTLKYF